MKISIEIFKIFKLMKKRIILFFLLFILLGNDLQAQQYKVITTVESIVPMGIGRSRIIDHTESKNISEATTERIDGKTSDQGKI